MPENAARAEGLDLPILHGLFARAALQRPATVYKKPPDRQLFFITY